MVNPASTLYQRLTSEVTENRDQLGTDHYRCLSVYYRGLKNNPRLQRFYQYNWVRRVTPMQQLITDLPRSDRTWRILDAGCGVGTESLFFSTLRDDLTITALDVHPERLNTAQARQAAYEKRLGRPSPISFQERNVFEVLRNEKFNLVWVMEAISHIDPAEEFISLVSENLGIPGYLVISDSHLLNPWMAWRIFKMRRRGTPERSVKTTSTGRTISYANERLFTAGSLTRLLRSSGFQSVQSQLSIFFPPKIAHFPSLFEFSVKCDRVLSRVPLIRNLGGIYTIVGGK